MLPRDRLELLKNCIHLIAIDGDYYLFATRANRMFKLTMDEALVVKSLLADDAVSTDTASFVLERNEELLNSLYSLCVLELPQSSEPILNSLVLLVSEACNFSCTYCYGSYDMKTQMMNEKTAIQAVDLALKLGIRDIVFFGGEPLLNFPVIKKTIEYIEALSIKDLTFRMTTNGSLVTEEIAAFLNEHRIQVSVSMDGNKEAQDLTRLFHDGSSTYYDTLCGIETLKAHGVLSLIEITFSARHKNLREQIISALDVFPVVSCACVDGHFDNKHDADTITGKSFQDYYHTLLDMRMDLSNGEELLGAQELYERLCNGEPFVHPKYLCSDIGTRLVVSPNGNVVPCPEMTENEKYVICNVNSIASSNELLEHRATVLERLSSNLVEQKWFSGLCETCIQHVKDKDGHFEYIDEQSFESCIDSLLIRFLRESHE